MYALLLFFGLGIGSAYLAYRLQLPFHPLRLPVLVGVPILVVIGQRFLTEPIGFPVLLALLLGYWGLVKFWLQAPSYLSLTPEDEQQLRTCFPSSIYHLQQFEVEDQRVVCVGHLRTENYRQAQRQIQDLVFQVFPNRFQVVLMQEFGQAIGCYLLPTPSSLPMLSLALSRFFAGWGAILLAQSQGSWVYGLCILFILGAREWTRARISGRFNLSLAPLITIPGSASFPIVGMGRALTKFPPDRRVYFSLGMSPAVVGLGLSLIFFMPGVLITWGKVGDISTDLQAHSLWGSLIGNLFNGQLQNMPAWGLAGWHGLIITALGLLPIGFLEGGYLVHSLLGHSWATLISKLARLALLALALTRYQELLIPALLFLLVDGSSPPALNDLDELPESWDISAIAMLALGLLLLFPLVG